MPRGSKIGGIRFAIPPYVLAICDAHRPTADGNIEFVNMVALILGRMGEIPEYCGNIDER
jgi:hypothetical protein